MDVTCSMKYCLIFAIVVLILLIMQDPSVAQSRTVGLFMNEPDAFPGYTLFAPTRYTSIYLINNPGELINSWDSDYLPGLSAYLLETGELLHTGFLGPGINPRFGTAGGAGGIIEKFDWDGTLVWQFEYSSMQHMQHHDVAGLPGGNVLLTAWEYKSSSEAINAGRDPSMLRDGQLWPDTILEIEPIDPASGRIVWEWHAWDHLIQDYDPTKPNYGIVDEHPELIDLNYSIRGQKDWLHINAVDYNETFDQIVLSVHNFNELWVIDHSTTIAEAAGHTGGTYGKGGDLLYRWGNPQTYGAGTFFDQKFFGQHDTQWIPSGSPGSGNFLIFNNGLNRPGDDYSSVEEINPPVDVDGNYNLIPGSAYEPVSQSWIYTADPPTDFFGQNVSGAERLPNGNTLICNGPYGTFLEINSAEEIVWLYINPVVNTGPIAWNETLSTGPGGSQNSVFKIRRYAPSYPGFTGRTLVPGDPIELYPEMPSLNYFCLGFICIMFSGLILHLIIFQVYR